MNKGTVAQVIVPVVDVDFSEGKIASILNALTIKKPTDGSAFFRSCTALRRRSCTNYCDGHLPMD